LPSFEGGQLIRREKTIDDKQFKNNIGETIFAAILFIMGLFMILYSRTFPKPTSLGHTMTGPSFFSYTNR